MGEGGSGQITYLRLPYSCNCKNQECDNLCDILVILFRPVDQNKNNLVSNENFASLPYIISTSSSNSIHQSDSISIYSRDFIIKKYLIKFFKVSKKRHTERVFCCGRTTKRAGGGLNPLKHKTTLFYIKELNG